MAGPIRIELSETDLTVSPGNAVTTRCTVYNKSFIVDEYRLRVVGIDPAWVDIPASTSRIFPEVVETVTVTFFPPRSATVAARPYPYEIVAASADNPAITASVRGTLTVEPFIDFKMELASPRQATTELEGTYKLLLSNTGNSSLQIALEARDETGKLELAFSDAAPTIPGNQSIEVTLIARPNERSLGAAGLYMIAVEATIASVDGAESPAEVRHTEQVTLQTLPGVQEPPVLSPQSVELDGQQASTRLVLRNRSAIPMVIGLSASDKAQALTFEFVGGVQVTVPPQDALDVPIRITCVDRTLLAAPPAPTSFTVVASPIHPAGAAQPVTGELRLPSPADFRLRLDPETVESTVAQRVALVIANVASRPEAFTVAATSKDASLVVNVSDVRVEVPARSDVTVPVDLAPDLDALAGVATAKTSGYVIRVAPVDSPGRSNEITGHYVFTPASLALKLKRKEIEAVAAATFEIEVENLAKNEVAVALSASDRLGACAYTFDVPRVRIPGRKTTLVQLTVTPPQEHKPDARWEFTVEAKPINLPGSAVQDTGVLVYRSPSVTLTLSPPERRGRRRRRYAAILTNPTAQPMTVKLAARDHSGGLGVGVGRDTAKLEPAQTATVPIKVTPRKRARGSGEASLAFTVVATPISPPGDATTTEGTFVALPPRTRWVYAAGLFVLLLAYLFLPVYSAPAAIGGRITLYEQTFYWANWSPERSWIVQDVSGKRTPFTKSGRHRFTDDVRCVARRIVDGDSGLIRDICFAQGPKGPKLQIN